MKSINAPYHKALMKPYLRSKKLREKIQTGVKRLRVIEQIVQQREKLGLTQAKLAEKIGVSQPFIARLENDEASNLSLETLVKIAHALNSDIDIKIQTAKKAA